MAHRQVWIAGLLIAVLAVAGHLAGPARKATAAPVIGSGSFSLANMNDVQTIYTSPTAPADWVAVTVTVSAGTVQVEKQVSGNWSSIGSVTATSFCIFEDQFEAVRVKASVPTTAGSYSTRGPTDQTNNSDHTVGAGSMSVGTSAVQVFSSTGSMSRGVFITVASGEVRLRTTANGSDILTIPAGAHDSYRSTAASYFLVGSGVADFTLLDDAPAGTWMPLPQAQWTDEFSPLYADRDGNLLEGNPSAPDDSGEDVVSRSVYDPDNEEYDTVHYVDNEALVTFTPSTGATTIRDLFEEMGVDILSACFDPDPEHPDTSLSWFHVHINPESEYYGYLPDLLDDLREQTCVEGAGYNDIGNACGYILGNEDEFFGHHTSTPRDFSNFDWTDGAQNELLWLHAMEAWNDKSGPGAGGGTYDTGSGIGVVVIDSGVDIVDSGNHYMHKDLKDKTGGVGISDKGSGKVYSGRISSSGGRFLVETEEYEFEHGTSVAGIIGAETYDSTEPGQDPNDERSEGIAGCGPDLSIFVAQAKWKSKNDGTGAPSGASVVEIVNQLREKFPTTKQANTGLRVVVLANAWEDAPEGLKKAIKKDIEANKRLYVAAAGNKAKRKKMYPAFWDGDIPGLLGVTAANNTAGVNWGSEGDDEAASGSTYWNEENSTTPSHYSVSGYWHALTTDYNGPEGAAGEVQGGGYTQINGTGFESQDYVDFYGTSAAAAQVAALAGLIYSRALKTNRLDGGSTDVTPSSVADMIRDNLKGDPLVINTSNGMTIPAVVDFKEAKNDISPTPE